MFQSLPTYARQFEKLLYIIIFCLVSISYGQSKKQLEKIRSQYNLSKMAVFAEELERNYSAKESQLWQLAKANNWMVSKTLTNGNAIELHDVSVDGAPIYYTSHSDVVSNASRANALYANGVLDLGIDGEGMQVGVWDEGLARTTHHEFGNRVTIADDGDDMSSHATRVTGTLIASGIKEKAKGVAFKATAITSNWKRDRIEVAEAAANGLLLSNHSYGIYTANVPDWYFGSYIPISQEWDEIMYNAPYYLMVSAVGNSQKSKHNEAPISGKDSDGFDLMLGFSTAKNGITVGAADVEVNDYGELEETRVTNYSSFGPIDDGRIKPDLASTGSFIYSTNFIDDASYDTSSGTSMATPGVTGSLLLLQQYYERLYGKYMKAATLKGLALHTADDVNEPGPDYKMGWGIINTKKAAEVIVNHEYASFLTEETLTQGERFSITVNANEKEALIASISWTDPASDFVNTGDLNNPTPALVNDLDIRITRNEDTYYPWKLNASQASASAEKGDNIVDPFEKVTVDNAMGSYTISITHKGNLKEGKQNFSLLISGINYTSCVIDTPSEFSVEKAEDSKLKMNWKEVPNALYEFKSKAENETEWSTVSTTENNIVLDNLELGVKYTYKLRTVCTNFIASEFSTERAFLFEGTHTKLEEILPFDISKSMERFSLNIYPNPSTDFIQLEGNVSDGAEYSISNTAGVLLQKGDATDARIGIGALATGLYIISVQDTQGYAALKFYKE